MNYPTVERGSYGKPMVNLFTWQSVRPSLRVLETLFS